MVEERNQPQAEFAIKKERAPEEYRQALEACRRAARRMQALTDDLLTLARADADRLIETESPCDLWFLVEDSVRLLERLAKEKGVAIEIDLEPAHVIGDPQRLAQFVTNLLTNAIQFNRPGGRVEVALRAEGSEAVLSIADTGTGIDPERLPHVFERFFRGDPVRSRASGGSGLGLAICQETVAAHGGRIVLASEPAKSATVTVRLPRASKKSP